MESDAGPERAAELSRELARELRRALDVELEEMGRLVERRFVAAVLAGAAAAAGVDSELVWEVMCQADHDVNGALIWV